MYQFIGISQLKKEDPLTFAAFATLPSSSLMHSENTSCQVVSSQVRDLYPTLPCGHVLLITVSPSGVFGQNSPFFTSSLQNFSPTFGERTHATCGISLDILSFSKFQELHTINDWNVYSCSSSLRHVVFKCDISKLCIGDFLAANRNSESIEQLISISCKDRVRGSHNTINVIFNNMDIRATVCWISLTSVTKIRYPVTHVAPPNTKTFCAVSDGGLDFNVNSWGVQGTVNSQRVERQGDNVREECHSQVCLCCMCDRPTGESTLIRTCRECVDRNAQQQRSHRTSKTSKCIFDIDILTCSGA